MKNEKLMRATLEILEGTVLVGRFANDAVSTVDARLKEWEESLANLPPAGLDSQLLDEFDRARAMQRLLRKTVGTLMVTVAALSEVLRESVNTVQGDEMNEVRLDNAVTAMRKITEED